MQSIVASPIIPVLPSQIGAETIQAVNARDLHEFLEVQSEFRNWIKNRIEQYGFTQDVDFVAGKFLPGSERIDYHLSLDMAKELSMVERNEKGKQARRYFIECERQAKALLPDFTNPAIAARAWADQVEARMLAEKDAADKAIALEHAKPSVEFHERVQKQDEHYSIREIAKILRTGEKKLRQWMRDERLICLDNTPYQEYMNRGYFRQVLVTLPNGGRLYSQTVVTGKGLAWLQRRLDHSLMGFEV